MREHHLHVPLYAGEAAALDAHQEVAHLHKDRSFHRSIQGTCASPSYDADAHAMRSMQAHLEWYKQVHEANSPGCRNMGPSALGNSSLAWASHRHTLRGWSIKRTRIVSRVSGGMAPAAGSSARAARGGSPRWTRRPTRCARAPDPPSPPRPRAAGSSRSRPPAAPAASPSSLHPCDCVSRRTLLGPRKLLSYVAGAPWRLQDKTMQRWCMKAAVQVTHGVLRHHADSISMQQSLGRVSVMLH